MVRFRVVICVLAHMINIRNFAFIGLFILNGIHLKLKLFPPG